MCMNMVSETVNVSIVGSEDTDTLHAVPEAAKIVWEPDGTFHVDKIELNTTTGEETLTFISSSLDLNTCRAISNVKLCYLYRPRSEGDNVLGSVRPSLRLFPLSRLNRLTYDLDIW